MADRFVFPPCDVVLGDKRWFFDEKTMTLKDYFVLKAAANLTRPQFLTGLIEDEPAALQALVWFVRRREEPDLVLADVDFLWDDLSMIDRREDADEPDEPDEPDEAGTEVDAALPPAAVPGDASEPSPGTTPSSSAASGSTPSPAAAT